MEEKLSISMDMDVQLARLIFDAAQVLSKMPPPNYKAGDSLAYTFTTEHMREGANLVFLAMDLIAERRK